MSENNISVERDFVGTLHIKVGDFDYVQIQYQHPFTDNASTRALADRIVAFLAQPAESEGVEVVGFLYKNNGQALTAADMDADTFTLMARSDFDGEVEKLVRQSAHLAALSAVTAERDRLQRNLNFTEQWYATRFERLADLGKSAGCWDVMAAIIANGTADQYEPPTYAQQLVRANHRAAMAERERDQLRAEVEALRKDKARLDAIEQECWDVRFLSSPNGDAGDSSISIEIVGHFMAEPCERVVGENYNENLRAALDQAMTAEAYPPARPEYDEYGCPVRAAMAAKEAKA